MLYAQTLIAIQMVTSISASSESEFREAVMQTTSKETKKAISTNTKRLNKASVRLDEIRKIIRKLYEECRAALSSCDNLSI